MAEPRVNRKLAAILSADVVGYSRLMTDDEAATVATLKQYRVAIGQVIDHHRGRIVNAPGDNILAEFASAVEAVQAAVGIQKAIEGRNAELPNERRMHLRIGLNLGDVIEEDDGTIYGDGVNIAARMEALADEGGICISSTIHDAVEGKLDFGFDFLGERPVKNIAKPVRVYRVRGEPGEKPRKSVNPQMKKFRLIMAVIVLVLGIAGVSTWLSERDPESSSADIEHLAPGLPPTLLDETSIAILPFANASSDAENDYFVDGMTETLITDLSRLPDLFVISLNSVLAYKTEGIDPRTVGQKLGVRYVLQGSAQRSGERLRVNAQLVETGTGRTLWAERFDRPVEDVFSIQDDIADQIVTALDVNLVAGEQARTWRKTTRNREAYDLYLRGRQHHDQFTREDMARARALQEQALSLDSNFTMAMVWLGWAHYIQGDSGWSDDPRASYLQAVAWGQKAIAIDPSLADAYGLLLSSLLNVERYAEALVATEKAIELGANQADVLVLAAWHLAWVEGRENESLRLVERALRLNPQPPFWYYSAFGDSLLNVSRIDEAIEAQKKCVEAVPEFLWCQLGLTLAYFDFGDIENAKAHAGEALKVNPALTAEDNPYVRGVPPSRERERVTEALRSAGLP